MASFLTIIGLIASGLGIARLCLKANIKFQNDDQISRLDSSKPYSRRIDNY